MSRPAYEGKIHRLQFTLCLREGEDDDLIALLLGDDTEPRQRARVVKAAMRQGVTATAVDVEIDEERSLNMLFSMMQ